MTEYKKDNRLSSYRTNWRLLSDEEKEEIKIKAVKKREEQLRLENIKKADIIAGRQKSILTAWGQ